MTITTDDITALRNLDDTLDTSLNDHERVAMLICACIDRGIRTRKAIRTALMEIGRNPVHVVISLKKDTGVTPNLRRWGQTKEGLYFNHPE